MLKTMVCLMYSTLHFGMLGIKGPFLDSTPLTIHVLDDCFKLLSGKLAIEQFHFQPVYILTKPTHQLELQTDMTEYLLGPRTVTH